MKLHTVSFLHFVLLASLREGLSAAVSLTSEKVGLSETLEPAGWPPQKAFVRGPVIRSDFADPCLIKVGNTWYAFASSIAGVNVQVAKSEDFTNWSLVKDKDGNQWDAFPKEGHGPWTKQPDPQMWAPGVIQREDGKFVLYYSANVDWKMFGINRNIHCVGAAVADAVTGPYLSIPNIQPMFCPLDQHGAIDATGFRDPKDGQYYVTYKVDSNGLGNHCNSPRGRNTPLMLQPVKKDGFSKIGRPWSILARVAEDGPLIENPTLIQLSNGAYTLFFDSHCWNTPEYDIKYAGAMDVKGPYDRNVRGGILLNQVNTENDHKIRSPGGPSMVIGSADEPIYMIFHGNEMNGPDQRWLYTARLNYTQTDDGRTYLKTL